MITLDILLPIAAKGALVLLLCGGLRDTSLNRSAAFRHMAWAGGLVALFLILPLLSLAMPELPYSRSGAPRGGSGQRSHPDPRAQRGRKDLASAPEVRRRNRNGVEAIAPAAPTARQLPEPAVITTRSPRSARARDDTSRARHPIIWLDGHGSPARVARHRPHPRPRHRAAEQRVARARVDRAHRWRSRAGGRHRPRRDSRVGHAERCRSPSDSSAR